MTSPTRILLPWGAGPFVAALVFLGAAQTTPPPGQGTKMYDVKTETTIAGTVETVEIITGTGGHGRRSLGGTHLIVKTSKESIEVHVGPTAYLKEKGIVVAKGDVVDILGSRVTIDNEVVLIAREIKKGDHTWILRDASGRPAWAGRAGS